MSEWRSFRLGEVADVYDGPHATPTKTDQGPWYLSISSLNNGRFDLTRSAHLSEEDYGTWTRRVTPQPGDTLFSYETRIGSVAHWPYGFPATLGRRMGLLRPHLEVVDPRFLTYAYMGPRFQEVLRANTVHGATVERLLIAQMPKWEMLIPSLAEQRRIAGVLGAFDDVIDTNLQLRSALDSLGRTLVGRWVLPLLDDPTGLMLAELGSVTSVIESGSRPRGGVAGISVGTPSIGAESISGLGVYDFTKTKYVPSDFAGKMRRGILQSRDVLVYKDGGKPGDFRPHVGMFGDGFPFDEMVINEHVFRVRAAEPLTEPYLHFWLSTEHLMARMRDRGTGAAIPGMNGEALRSLPVLVPPREMRAWLFPMLDSIVGAALACSAEARQISTSRDELLPLLMSGRVTVDEAWEAVS